MSLGSMDLAIDQAEAGLSALARVDVTELTDQEVLDLNQAAQRLRTRADAVCVQAAGALDTSGAWAPEGAKSAAAVLSHYGHLENIPRAPGQWEVTVRGSAKLCATLAEQFEDALLFRTLARLRTDIDVGSPAEWGWDGPRPGFEAACAAIDAADVVRRIGALSR